MKRCVLFLSLLSFSISAKAATTLRLGLTQGTTQVGDIWGTFFNNDMSTIDSGVSVLSAKNTYTSTNTFLGPVQLSTNTISPGSCLTVNSTGTVITQSCGGAGGSSTLATFVGSSGNPGVAVSSPTSGINVNSADFTGSLQGSSTFFLSLNASSPKFIQNTSSLQSGATAYISSATIQNLNVSTITFIQNGSTQTVALNSGSFINNSSTLQSATMNITSGTVNALTASTITVNNLLQVKGTGATGTTIVAQVAASTFNVLANGNVGIGTISPSANLQVVGNVIASTITVSSATVNGQLAVNSILWLTNGTVQVSSPPVGGGGSTNPSGPNYGVQVDSNGAFGASQNFTSDGSSVTLKVPLYARGSGNLLNTNTMVDINGTGPVSSNLVFSQKGVGVSTISQNMFNGLYPPSSGELLSITNGVNSIQLSQPFQNGGYGVSGVAGINGLSNGATFYVPGTVVIGAPLATVSTGPAPTDGMYVYGGVILASNTIMSGATFYANGSWVFTNPLSVSNGGTGTSSPGLIAGTNITSITGSWPNQTINAATQGGGGVSSLAMSLGTSSAFSAPVSSPTSAAVFDNSQFGAQLTGGATFFLTIAYSTNAQTGSYTAKSTDTVVVANCASACTITLPTAASISGKVYHINNQSSNGIQVTVGTTSSQTIDGSTTQIMYIQYTNMEVISNGSNWLIL